MGKKLYVGSLSYSVDDKELEKMFSEAGTVESAKVIVDLYSGRSKGFGFVEMSSDDEAQAAIKALNGASHDGRTIVVNEAQPQAPRGGGGGGRSGGGGFGGGGGRGGNGGGGFGGGGGGRSGGGGFGGGGGGRSGGNGGGRSGGGGGGGWR